MSLNTIINSASAKKRLAGQIILNHVRSHNKGESLSADQIALNSNLARDWGFDSLDILKLASDLDKQLGGDLSPLQEIDQGQLDIKIIDVIAIIPED
jgi:acyl carrier protein